MNEKVDYWKNYSSIAKDPAGTVFFAAIPAICTYLLNNVFFTLESVFPKINVSLFDIDMLDFPRLLRNSNAKMGLNAVSLYQDEQAQVIYQYRKYGLNYQAVADDKYCIAISTKDDWAQHDAISKESLNQKRYISYCMKNNTSVAESMFKNLGHYPNSSNILYLNSISSILQAVSDNKGYTSFLQCVFFNNVYVKNKLIRTVNLSDSSATPIVHHLVWADESSLSPAESAILHYLLDNYTAMFENAASSIK